MKVCKILFLSVFIFPFMAQGQQQKKDSEKVIVKEVKFTSTEETVDPPPMGFTSKFKNLHDWLVNISTTNKPNKKITQYNFGLFEYPNDYTLFLAGENTYHESSNSSATRIEFQPKNIFFNLPKTYFKNLNRKQLLAKLVSDLKSFSNTREFQSSYFIQAKRVVFESNGQTIWAR